MSPSRKKYLARLEIARRRGANDLFYFAKVILGYDKMTEATHAKLCLFLQKEIEHGRGEHTTKLILMPRGSFKSTIATIAYSLWRLISDPELTILITNEKLDKSKGFLKAIIGHIEGNDLFKILYGDLSCAKKRGKKWSETRIDIATRTKADSAPSVEASSVESSETGKHVDIIICDDLVGKSNYNTPEQLAKVDDYVKDLGAVLKPGGLMQFIGTRWDYRDTYQTQLDFIEKMGKLSRAEVMIEKAVQDDGNLFFPEELSDQFLKSQRIRQGTYFFSCQYLNTPVSREDALIQRIDKFKDKIDGMPVDKVFKDYPHFVSVDLAYTETKRSDSTAIVVNAVNPRTGKWHIRHYETFKTGDPDKVIERLFAVDKKFKPMRYGIEKNNFTAWLKTPLEDAMRRRNHFLPIDPPDGLAHWGQSSAKVIRLRKLAPQFNMGEAVIHESMIDLEDQLRTLTYDGARGHDDLLDALAMQAEIVVWGIGEVANKYDNDMAPENLTWGEHKERCRHLERAVGDDAWMYN